MTDTELVTLCSEFLTAGAGTTSTALQWIMANLVKHRDIQSKLYDEIRTISDADVAQDVELDKSVIPKETTVNVMLAEIGRDSKVWNDPMVFQPERFLNVNGSVNKELSDVTGKNDMKMIPFGAGRRMCPASGLAMLHLQYFVANFIKEFKWMAKVGDDIDLSEKQAFTVVMKIPLWVMFLQEKIRLTLYVH
ncbi:hypothetical protein C5167_007467 [Papaver somniferum]|nr:hypothetical protein C5167_007467 [Papaver somniferum]